MVDLRINGFNSDPGAQAQLDQMLAGAGGGRRDPRREEALQLLAMAGGQLGGNVDLNQGAFGSTVPGGMQVANAGQQGQGQQGAQGGGAGKGRGVQENPADQLRQDMLRVRTEADEVQGTSQKDGIRSAAGTISQQLGGQMGQVSQVGQQVRTSQRLGDQADQVLKSAEKTEQKGQSLQQTGQGMQQAGQTMIQTGTSMIAVGKALQSNPFTAAAGAAMEAAGQAIKLAGQGIKTAGQALEQSGQNMERLGQLQKRTGQRHEKLAEKIGKQADEAVKHMRESTRSGQEAVDRLRQGDESGDYRGAERDIRNQGGRTADRNRAFNERQSQSQREIDEMFREAEAGASGNEQPGRGRVEIAGNGAGAGDNGNQFGGGGNNPFGGMAMASAGGGAGAAVTAVPMLQMGAVA